jgi:hypothetical protein
MGEFSFFGFSVLLFFSVWVVRKVPKDSNFLEKLGGSDFQLFFFYYK